MRFGLVLLHRIICLVTWPNIIYIELLEQSEQFYGYPEPNADPQRRELVSEFLLKVSEKI